MATTRLQSQSESTDTLVRGLGHLAGQTAGLLCKTESEEDQELLAEFQAPIVTLVCILCLPSRGCETQYIGPFFGSCLGVGMETISSFRFGNLTKLPL